MARVSWHRLFNLLLGFLSYLLQNIECSQNAYTIVFSSSWCTVKETFMLITFFVNTLVIWSTVWYVLFPLLAFYKSPVTKAKSLLSCPVPRVYSYHLDSKTNKHSWRHWDLENIVSENLVCGKEVVARFSPFSKTWVIPTAFRSHECDLMRCTIVCDICGHLAYFLNDVESKKSDKN